LQLTPLPLWRLTLSSGVRCSLSAVRCSLSNVTLHVIKQTGETSWPRTKRSHRRLITRSQRRQGSLICASSSGVISAPRTTSPSMPCPASSTTSKRKSGKHSNPVAYAARSNLEPPSTEFVHAREKWITHSLFADCSYRTMTGKNLDIITERQ